MIELKDVTKTYVVGQHTTQALRGVSFKISAGEWVSIVGSSGSGKSTMMNIMGLLDRPDSGDYYLDSKKVSQLHVNTLAELRNQYIGFVFQSFHLLPRLTAIENVALPLSYRSIERQIIRIRALDMLKKVGMAEYSGHKPAELSGGQQQRVAIARALIGDPKIILADEPTGALDSKTASSILDLFRYLHKEEKKTIFMITHDNQIAKQSEKIIRVQDGAIREIFNVF